MRLPRTTVAAGVAALAVAAAALAATDSRPRNGSFEEPVAPDGGFVRIFAGDTFQGGWRVVSGSVDVVRIGVAADGAQWLDLNGAGAGSIEQDVPTTPGQQYRLRFSLAANPDPACGPPRVVKLRVVWENAAIRTYSFDTTGHDFDHMGWVRKAFGVTASGASAIVRFFSLTQDPPECGPAIDAVILRART
jgi:choice-of-anchor C domain-containing protein